MSEDMHHWAIPAANIPCNASTPIARRLFLPISTNAIGDLVARCKKRAACFSVDLAREQYCGRRDFSNDEVVTLLQRRRYNGKAPIARVSVIIQRATNFIQYRSKITFHSRSS
jgi:hypothetical protein